MIASNIKKSMEPQDPKTIFFIKENYTSQNKIKLKIGRVQGKENIYESDNQHEKNCIERKRRISSNKGPSEKIATPRKKKDIASVYADIETDLSSDD